MKQILFLCTGNSCRSQMAEGFARALLDKSGFRIESAGIESHGLNPRAVMVMRECNIDLSGQQSSILDEGRLDEFDLVVTVCGDADERCPAVRSKRHWPLADPARFKGSDDEILEEFRRIRDDIFRRVVALKEELEGVKTDQI